MSDESDNTGNFLLGNRKLDNVAWHDFAHYSYVLDPDYTSHLTLISEVAPSGPSTTDREDFLFALSGKFNEAIAPSSLVDAVPTWVPVYWPFTDIVWFYLPTPPWYVAAKRRSSTHLTEFRTDAFKLEAVLFQKARTEARNLVRPLVKNKILSCLEEESDSLDKMVEIWIDRGDAFLSWISRTFSEITDQEDFYLSIFFDHYNEASIRTRWRIISRMAEDEWVELDEDIIVETPPIKYSFEYFIPGSWNLGLRVVYRQEWRALGNQRGEIVKTIPLGPKQVEKVSTKIVRRTKVTKTSESLKSTEISTETTDTTKDSSEVVNEASESFGWKTEAEASVDIGFAQASVSGEVHSDTTRSSKATSSKLSESMQKSASKIRTETKLVVTSESETTEEMETASEIYNPNEEISITYVYSKLQRQYEILTSVAEVHSVMMVAEKIPDTAEIGYEWVKEHDWILSKVLLDDSFRETLNSISQGIKPARPSKDSVTEAKAIVESTLGHLGTISGTSSSLSLANIDIVQEAQKGLKEATKEYEHNMEVYVRDIEKYNRFYNHIRKNILYYCRAIWASEDIQQRLLRYRSMNIFVPTEWEFIDDEGNIADLQSLLDSEDSDIDGNFRGIPESEVNIADIITPEGPVGFHGNYAIHYLKSEYHIPEFFPILHILKTPYLYFDDDHPNGILMDPLLKHYTDEFGATSASDISEDTKEDMVDYIPELRLLYEEVSEDYDSLSEFVNEPLIQDLFEKHYPEYLFRLDLTRRFVLDTNNLVIDIIPGTGSAIEEYKLEHRRIDMLKAAEEKEKLVLENKRMRQLLKQKLFDAQYWPVDEKKLLIYSDPKVIKKR
jgi:hypothetical protein